MDKLFNYVMSRLIQLNKDDIEFVVGWLVLSILSVSLFIYTIVT
jgi:hypothetical protein